MTSYLLLPYQARGREKEFPPSFPSRREPKRELFTLPNDDVLQIVYAASTDKGCGDQLHQPFLFNLAGNGSGSVADQLLLVNADRYTPVGSSGTTYRQTEGFTLETQHFPDSPNKPDFPTTELKPRQVFRSTTIFRFATDAPLPPLPR